MLLGQSLDVFAHCSFPFQHSPRRVLNLPYRLHPTVWAPLSQSRQDVSTPSTFSSLPKTCVLSVASLTFFLPVFVQAVCSACETFFLSCYPVEPSCETFSSFAMLVCSSVKLYSGSWTFRSIWKAHSDIISVSFSLSFYPNGPWNPTLLT